MKGGTPNVGTIDDAVIGHAHSHKLCGIATTSDCSHRGIESHTTQTYNGQIMTEADFQDGG